MTGARGQACPDSLRVLIADDEPLMRLSLQKFLDASDGIDVVETCSGPEALAAVAAHRPDVVLLDIEMQGLDGMTVLRQIASVGHAPKIIVLTKSRREDDVSLALFVGATGYLLKDTDPEQLVHDIRSLTAGRRPLATPVATAVINGYLARCRTNEAPALVGTLSPRERYALSLLGRGLTNLQIARRMGVAPSTAKDHVSALLAKLGNLNRVQAAVIADRAGITAWSPGLHAHQAAEPVRKQRPVPATAKNLAYV
ncbi:DNA-binding response regulator [Streptomyces albofaciens JCM 4342]|uniref:response regulator n=1 Tax=Streptomyces albofaciens TaxID=66866 RepID=UPI00123C5782|nr:response regulator transcription factor [Streptomyces albofaciens]KAA6215076.1 DNA-binding response regulator [Streptomyces albofaciens JCM 4342]